MTLVVAHRGASAHAPENTLDAFRQAVEMGADAIELDVHVTRDGQLAVIHDETLERTTDLEGRVSDLTMKQIRRADAGYRFAAADGSFPFRAKGLKVPTLPEVLGWLPAGTGLVVEIKASAAVGPVVEALRGSAVRTAGEASAISFEQRSIDEVHQLDPGLPTGYLLVPFESFDAGIRYAVQRGHAAVHLYEGDLGLDPAPKLSQARAFGLLVGCYVVNDPVRMAHLAAYGLWGFVTDWPDVGRQTLGPRGSWPTTS
jgi:glycerophosphoryl diester phosphodiesterase